MTTEPPANDNNDEFAELTKGINFDKSLAKNDFDVIGALPVWTRIIFILLLPAALITNGFTHSQNGNLLFGIILGVILLCYLQFKDKTVAPNREPFTWVTNLQNKTHPTTSRDANHDSNMGTQVSLSEHEAQTWNTIINKFREPNK